MECRLFVWIVCILLFQIHTAMAFNGIIDPDKDGHHFSYGENIGWLNFAPDKGQEVIVLDEKLSGFVWAENVGWIKLDPAYGGVWHNGKGKLTGFAWSENCGWINFSCLTNSTCDQVNYGVTIDVTNGQFNGYAWGENIGWIKFDYAGYTNPQPSLNYVTTSWRKAVAGDIDGNGIVTLEDLIVTLHICAGNQPGIQIYKSAEINEDSRIGIEEAFYILKVIAGL